MMRANLVLLGVAALMWGRAVVTLADELPVREGADAFQLAEPGTVQVQGWIGEKIDLCQQQRIWNQDPDRYAVFLRNHNDKDNWRGEYWGKWYTAAVLAYANQPTPERLTQLEKTARDVVAAQADDGYLGPYLPENRLTCWDVWCRKYVLLGLIAAYDLTGDQAFLTSACRNVENLIAELDQKQLKLVDVAIPVLQGTADSSLLEPLALLYQRTGNEKYLAFARSIIDLWNAPFASAPQGIHLLENALADKPPLRNHAYCIMSCFEGLCELYRATGDRQYLEGALHFAHSVRQYERMIDGSVSNHELFFDGVRQQTEIIEQPQETCATVTWMKLCVQLLRLTGDPLWADELEVSLYNAMAGAMTPDGDWFCYFTPLTGERVPGFVPHPDLTMSCCVASGPRGLLLTPRWAVMESREGPVVNLFASGTATVELANGAKVGIVQETDYPVGDRVRLTISPGDKQQFTLRVRIPAWSEQTRLTVNGEETACEPGKYAVLDRVWEPGDKVEMVLDLRGRAVPAPSGAPQLALMRGPIVLALDNRLVPPTDSAVWLQHDGENRVELKPHADKPKWAWMAFDVTFEVHPSHFFGFYTVDLAVCDFASAGNAWSADNLYRTWISRPLYVSHAFVANTWKLVHPDIPRPEIPPVEK